MGFSDYKHKKNNVINLLDKIKEGIGENYIKERIQNKIKDVKEDRFTIAVFGHFSNGKSTFLNTLMGYGDEILKEDEVASTATITRLVYPEDLNLLNKAKIIYSNKEEQIVDCYDIKEFTSRNEEFNVEENIDEVIVYFDSEFLKNGVEIVDTPGFNSTHKLHTKIAKSYIRKADASIFLFAADKPGAKEELNFLNEINENIERVFFLLNKIDLCNFTEGGSIESACDNLRNKLVKVGISMEGKKIYPISALKKKESIKENSKEKNIESRFDIFTQELSEYLTGDENTKDRLGAPLNFTLKELIDYKNELNEKVNSFSTNKEEIENKIKNQNDIVKNMEKDLKDKQKHIEKSIKNILKSTENSLKERVEKLEDNLNEELSGIKSSFSINLYDFNEINEGILRRIKRIWDKEKLEIEYKLGNIINEIVDEQSQIEDIEKKIMPIIYNGLKIQNININKPMFNFDALDEIDKEIEKYKGNYQKTRVEVNKLRNLKGEKEIVEGEYNELKEKIRRLEEEKRIRIRNLGKGELVSGEKTVRCDEERGGFIGIIVDMLVGPKKIEKVEEFIDDSSYKYIQKETEKLDESYDSKERKFKNEINSIKDKIIKFSSIEYQLDEYLEEQNEEREKYLNLASDSDKRKAELQSEIINMTKSKYKSEVRKVLDDFDVQATGFLKNNRNYLIKIISQSLENDIKKLEKQKEKVYDLFDVSDLKPDILEKKIKNLYVNIDKNNAYINELMDAKEII
jgi:uncharacterized membrane-anchored protein YhcB (DUF1043 family)